MQSNPLQYIDETGLREWKNERIGTSVSLFILSGSAQFVTFISNCENNKIIERRYIVAGLGIGFGFGLKSVKGLDHSFSADADGYFGTTNVSEKRAKYGISISGPSAAFGELGGTIGSANIGFDSYSEVYGLSKAVGLGVTIFNFEGQRYFKVGLDKVRSCGCDKSNNIFGNYATVSRR